MAQALGRTISHPRHYNTNGSGRDTYISNNCGGHTIENSPSRHIKSGSLFSTQNRRAESVVEMRPVIHSKIPIYKGNGTGRDSYISNNSGGFTLPNVVADYRQAYFQNSLRDYTPNGQYLQRRRYTKSHTKLDKVDSASKRDVIRALLNENRDCSPQEKLYFQEQTNLSKRLSLPKKPRIKFKETSLENDSYAALNKTQNFLDQKTKVRDMSCILLNATTNDFKQVKLRLNKVNIAEINPASPRQHVLDSEKKRNVLRKLIREQKQESRNVYGGGDQSAQKELSLAQKFQAKTHQTLDKHNIRRKIFEKNLTLQQPEYGQEKKQNSPIQRAMQLFIMKKLQEELN